MRLRGLWLSVHKWIGLCLAVLIIPISLSGAILVWDDAANQWLNPGRFQVTSDAARLAPSAYVAAAQGALQPGERIASLRYPDAGEGGPIQLNVVQPPRGDGGRPTRATIWLDPGTGRVLDRAAGNGGLVGFIHNLHGNLMVPGTGRTIVGIVGAAMFCSCLTGLWLWWPITGSLRRGFRWRRQNSTNANLHHLLGFWIVLPLAMLSFTGAWISFPGLSGGAPPPPGGGDRARATAALPLERPATGIDSVLAAARRASPAAPPLVTWPTDQAPLWRVTLGGAELEVDDATGAAGAPRPPRPETTARLMRRLHDGTGMGLVWRALITLGGIVPALLAVTGIVMWLRSRGWRAALAKKRKTARLAPQPAE